MILIDRRIGSAHLRAPLRRFGLLTAHTTLAFGDLSFNGKGPLTDEGDPAIIRVGIERKTVSEILGCLTDVRFTGHQLPGLLRTFDRVYLLIEGRAFPDPESGILMAWKGRRAGHGRHAHLYSTYEAFLLTLQHKAGITIARTQTGDETAHWVHAVYRWWQKPWNAHGSHYAVEANRPDVLITEHQALCRILANQIPDIGWKRSRDVWLQFGSWDAASRATVAEWANVVTTTDKGKKIKLGAVRAARIHAALRLDERTRKAMP